MSLFGRERRVSNLSSLGTVLESVGRSPRQKMARPVNDDTATKIAAFTACVQLITRNVATLPVDAFKKSGGARRPMAVEPPIVRQPSAVVSRITWVSQIVWSLLMRGNAYGYVTQFDATGWPTKIEILHPDSVVVKQSDQLVPATYWRRSSQGLVELDPLRVMHIVAYPMAGSAVGMSPLTYMAWTLGLASGEVDYASEFLNGAGHPTAILSTDRVLDKDQADRAKERFKQATEGDRLAALGGGWTYTPVQVSPGDAQLLGSRQFTAVEICQFMGVPPTKIGAAMSGTSVTYANRDQNQLDYYNDSLLWWLANIEEAWSAQLRGKGFVKFNLDAFLRPDPATRSQIIDRKLRNGTLSADEARALDDMPPLPDHQGELFIWPPAAPAAVPQGSPNA